MLIVLNPTIKMNAYYKYKPTYFASKYMFDIT